MTLVNGQGNSHTYAGNVEQGRGHSNGQTTGTRPANYLDEYAKKLESWIGMEDDDEFMYFDDCSVQLKADDCQRAR
jgi:hypothetical protein